MIVNIFIIMGNKVTSNNCESGSTTTRLLPVRTNKHSSNKEPSLSFKPCI